MKKVLILGCGWVAEDLATKLLADGHQVWATTTQEEKASRLYDLGINAIRVNFDTDNDLPSIPVSFDYVLTSVPASSKIDLQQTKARFENVKAYLQRINYTKNIYLSSIGVYPNIDYIFDEDYDDIMNERLIVAEDIMLSLDSTVIYRLGGLFGKNRIFAKYFENRICTTGDQLSNFVHVDDVVQLICQGFQVDLKCTIYNIVAPLHPKKKDVIIASAMKHGYQVPLAWEPNDSFQKLVHGTRITQELDYSFLYADPLLF